MKEKNIPPEEDGAELGRIRLTDLQSAIGLQRYDIRGVITTLKENPLAETDCPPKAMFAAMEALQIDTIWKRASQWISDHPDVRGLSYSELPELSSCFRELRDEYILPRFSEDVGLTAVDPGFYEELCRTGSMPVARDMTRSLLQSQLLLWEIDRKDHADDGSPETALYKRYTDMLKTIGGTFSGYRFPATRKMFAGFSFGQSVLWELPDNAHATVIPKLAHSHLCVIQEAYSRDQLVLQKGSMEQQGDVTVLSESFYAEMAMRVHRMVAHMHAMRSEPFGEVAYSNIITSCPAVFTTAFEGIAEWIRAMRSDMQKQS